MTPDERVAALRLLVQLPDLDSALALESLTHRSYGNENRVAAHSERLEFLGDAVVDLAVSHQLMRAFPLASEGQLSRLRAVLVSEEGLAKVARALDLGRLLLLGRGEERSGGRDKPSLLADALEAVLGAVYLSGGIGASLKLVEGWFREGMKELDTEGGGEDFKSRLQERIQTLHKQAPRYRVVNEAGPDHEKRFEVEVFIGDSVLGRGEGRSKKEAEQAAAQKTLALLAAVEEKGAGQEEA